MKNSWQILTLLLAVATLVLALKVSFSQNAESTEVTPMDNSQIIIDNIMSRSSVRNYTAQQVEDDKIELMLRAGMAAPSAGNLQPWSFVVVDDRAILDAIPPIIKGAHMADKAQLAIVVCGTPVPQVGLLSEEYWIQDCSAVTENILLAAHGLGLGAVWCGAYPENGSGKVEAMSKLLNLPSGTFALSVIVVGYPDGKQLVKDKWNESKVHYNKF